MISSITGGGCDLEFLNDREIESYLKNVIGNKHFFSTELGRKRMIYADWAASGRLYRPIEEKICNEIGPLYGNTHSSDSYIGRYINSSYEMARKELMNLCNATKGYELLLGGSGATYALHRFQEIMAIKEIKNVLVFISSHEHNSNYLTWIALKAKVIIIPTSILGIIDLDILEGELKNYINYDCVIGSFIASSNVTGIETNYIEAVKLVKYYGGIGVVDYSAMAPHTQMDFSDSLVDVAYWGTHKFLGGPGGPGVLLFKTEIYQRETPTIPAGGTVLWTDPEQRAIYINEISKREDPGTPAILQTLRATMVHQLINEIGVSTIDIRESGFVKYLISTLSVHPSIHVFAEEQLDRKPIISFIIKGLNYSIVTKALSDYYGIQVRGGCSCAGIFSHELLEINKKESNEIYQQIINGNYDKKPGWVRVSLHAVMRKKDVEYIADSVYEIASKKDFFRQKYL